MATAQYEDALEGAEDEMDEPVVPRVVDGLKRADSQLVAFVQERPLAALGLALAFGYVVGRVVTHRS
jgi:ElaB/YqjD/DUF883 family membrane-anchored ribosome-binding protein